MYIYIVESHGGHMNTGRITLAERRPPPGKRVNKFYDGLKIGNSDIYISNINQLLLKHM